MSNNYIIYLLYNTSNNSTYVGITNNQERRLRQHNGELVGGAKYTKAKKGVGSWKFYGWIKANEDSILEKIRSLKLEYRVKYLSRKSKGTPIEKRLKAINQILADNTDLTFQLNLETILEPSGA
jgi:putative endonuclease